MFVNLLDFSTKAGDARVRGGQGRIASVYPESRHSARARTRCKARVFYLRRSAIFLHHVKVKADAYEGSKLHWSLLRHQSRKHIDDSLLRFLWDSDQMTLRGGFFFLKNHHLMKQD